MTREFKPRKREIQKGISCKNKECEMYKEEGSIVVMKESKRKRPAPIYECLACHKRFSARRGTPLFGLRKDDEKIIKALHMLVEKGSIRGTARVIGVTKDTMCSWLKLAAKQADLVNDYFVKNLDFDQVQMDELWTFVKKKTTYPISGNVKKLKQ